MRAQPFLTAFVVCALTLAGCSRTDTDKATPTATATQPAATSSPATVSPLARKACAALAEADRLRADPGTAPGAANIAEDRAVIEARRDQAPELEALVGPSGDDATDLSASAERLRVWCSSHP